jgi:superfamily II DNA or RNA helicase
MAEMHAQKPDTRFLILVPSLALLDQWVVALREELGLPSEEIGVLGGGEKPSESAKVVVAVINSGRSFSQSFSAVHPTALIVDECHRAGSEKNAEALAGTFIATLGLSATPEREYDDGFEKYIVPALGEIIYRYSYVDAAHDGVISQFGLVNIKVPLLPAEQEAYDEISAKISRVRYLANRDADAEFTLRRLLQKRAADISKITWRVPASVKLIDQNRHQRAIVFHERVSDAEKIFRLLKERGHNAVIYHSGVEPVVRRENLRLFRTGVHDVLVCCRALDEGMNVPETTVAVVASSTASLRQRIQRLGRILRPAPGKEHAIVYTLYATADEENRLRTEANRLGDVSRVRWQRLKVPENGTLTLPR